MGRFGPRDKQAEITISGDDWLGRIITRTRLGQIVPIISNALTNQLVFGSHTKLWSYWPEYVNLNLPESDRIHFPENLHDPAKLSQLWSINTQYEALEDHRRVKEKYLEFLVANAILDADDARISELRSTINWQQLPFSEVAHRLGLAAFQVGKRSALTLLASLRLPVYVTTSYHTFLEMALHNELNKEPHQEICRWYLNRGRPLAGTGSDIKSAFDSLIGGLPYEPSADEPVVAHLFGIDTIPASLVLTEDDHFDFLVSVASDRRVLHSNLRSVLRESSVILLGYSLHDWEFKVLFRLLASLDRHRAKGFYVQLQNSQEERKYLEYYLRTASFEPVWLDTLEFLDTVWRANRGASRGIK